MRVVFDIETNGLEAPTKVWCVVCKDIASGKVYTFNGQDPKSVAQLRKLFLDATELIGHNIIGYDLKWLRKLLHLVPNKGCRITDTLVLSRLVNFSADGGHSLREWGDRLNFPKYEYDQFEMFEQDMLTYCIRDVELTHAVFVRLMASMHPVEEWSKAIEVEHFVAQVCETMHDDGFNFDYGKAKELYEEVTKMVADLDATILPCFPQKSKLVRVVSPRNKADGTLSKVGISSWYDGDDYSIFQAGAEFSLVEWVPFNPASTKQVVERLNEAGWSPFERTKTYLEALRSRDTAKLKKLDKTAWKINEANLSTLPDNSPEGAKLLVKRIMLNHRLTTLDTWFKAYDESDKSVHGTFNSIGTWTHRMSHTNPNLGNIAAKKSIKYKSEDLAGLATALGGRMRALWLCAPLESLSSPDRWLVGTDADGIQLRILAHYMGDKDFTDALVAGDSKLGTDAHTLNQKALGTDVCKTRDTAKTFRFRTSINLLNSGDILNGQS